MIRFVPPTALKIQNNYIYSFPKSVLISAEIKSGKIVLLLNCGHVFPSTIHDKLF